MTQYETAQYNMRERNRRLQQYWMRSAAVLTIMLNLMLFWAILVPESLMMAVGLLLIAVVGMSTWALWAAGKWPEFRDDVLKFLRWVRRQ